MRKMMAVIRFHDGRIVNTYCNSIYIKQNNDIIFKDNSRVFVTYKREDVKDFKFMPEHEWRTLKQDMKTNL